VVNNTIFMAGVVVGDGEYHYAPSNETETWDQAVIPGSVRFGVGLDCDRQVEVRRTPDGRAWLHITLSPRSENWTSLPSTSDPVN
jgi:hypothetical protein